MIRKRPAIVFFDVGNTLIYPDPPVGEVYARAMREEGFACGGEEVERVFLQVWQELREEHGGQYVAYGVTEEQARNWWRTVVMRSLEPFGSPKNSDVLFERLWDHFASGEAWALYPDVLLTLEELEQLGAKRGLISNWDCRLVPLLKELGLWERFEPRLISFQEGCEKPSREIFVSALRNSRCSADEAIHVGDSYEEDVLGAQAAGIMPVWLRRDRPSSASPCEFAVIGRLTELLDLFWQDRGTPFTEHGR